MGAGLPPQNTSSYNFFNLIFSLINIFDIYVIISFLEQQIIL